MVGRMVRQQESLDPSGYLAIYCVTPRQLLNFSEPEVVNNVHVNEKCLPSLPQGDLEIHTKSCL